MSDIDAVAVDSLKALDPTRPIREADVEVATRSCLVQRFGRFTDHDERCPVFGIGPFRVLRIFDHNHASLSAWLGRSLCRRPSPSPRVRRTCWSFAISY